MRDSSQTAEYRYRDEPAMTSSHFSLTSNLIRHKNQRMKCITVSVLGIAIFAILLAYAAFADKDGGGKPDIKVAYVVSDFCKGQFFCFSIEIS